MTPAGLARLNRCRALRAERAAGELVRRRQAADEARRQLDQLSRMLRAQELAIEARLAQLYRQALGRAQSADLLERLQRRAAELSTTPTRLRHRVALAQSRLVQAEAALQSARAAHQLRRLAHERLDHLTGRVASAAQRLATGRQEAEQDEQNSDRHRPAAAPGQ